MMKFDVVIGNPPYRAPRTKGMKVWVEFIKRVTVMKPNFIAFVTPNSWFYEPDRSKIKQATKALMTGNIVFGDTSRRISEEFFHGISEDIGYCIWSKDKAPSTLVHRTGIVNDYQVSMTLSTFNMTSYLCEKANKLKELILTYGVDWYFSDRGVSTLPLVTVQMPMLPIAASVGINLFDSKLLEKLGPLVFCETDDGFIDYRFYTKGRFICLEVFEFKNKDLKNKMKSSIATLKQISETCIHRPYEVDDVLLNQAYECCKFLDPCHIRIPRQIVAHYIDIDYDLSTYKYQIGDIKIHLNRKDNLPTSFTIFEPGFKPLFVYPNKHKPIRPFSLEQVNEIPDQSFSPERLCENLERATSLFEEKKSHKRRKKIALAILLFFFCLMPWLPPDAVVLFVCYLAFCGFYLNT